MTQSSDENNGRDVSGAKANALPEAQGAADDLVEKESERQAALALQQARSVLEKLPMVGPIVWLYLHAPSHKHIFVADVEWMVMPPLVLGQCKLYMKNDAPLAYASWAFVDEEVEKRLVAGRMRLAPKDWKSGDRLWLIDLVAPFGGGKDVIKDLRENVFPSRTIKQLVPGPDGKSVRPVEWKASDNK